MDLINKNILDDYKKKHSDSVKPLANWERLVHLAQWKAPQDIKSLSTNKLILIAPCAILSSRKNNGGKHGNDKAENMGNNG